MTEETKPRPRHQSGIGLSGKKSGGRRIDPEVLRSAIFGQTLSIPTGDPEPFDFSRQVEFDIEQPQPKSSSQPIRNLNKLTPAEDWLLNALPGVADNSTVQWLTKQTQTPLGSAFVDVVDWFGDKLERTMGTAYQLAYDPDLLQDLGRVDTWFTEPEKKAQFHAAWGASVDFYNTIAPPNFGVIGGTFAAMADPRAWGAMEWNFDEFLAGMRASFKSELPPGELTSDELFRISIAEGAITEMEAHHKDVIEHWKRVFTGLDVEVGGLSQIIAAREALLAGVPIEEIQANHLESLGALAVRSQFFDFIGHVVFDPLNVIIPHLKLGERLMSVRHAARFKSVSPAVSAAMTDVTKIADGMLDFGGDAVKAAEEIFDISSKTGLDEVSDLAIQIATHLEDGTDLSKPFNEMNDIIKTYDEISDLGRYERILFRLSGGDPLNPADWTKGTIKAIWQDKGPMAAIAAGTGRLVTLTPQSRAVEWMTTSSNAIRGLLDSAGGPSQWIGTLKRAAAGAFGGTLGHMMITPAGRTVQATLKQWMGKGDELLKVWQATTVPRETGQEVARVLGMDFVEMMVMLQRGDDDISALWARLNALVGTDVPSPLIQSLQDGSFTKANLIDIAEIFKPSKAGEIIPFTDDLFRAALMRDVIETAAVAGATTFGVTEAPLITKAADALKATESFLLLGLNPFYPIRNFFNNEVTIISRGLFNQMGPDEIGRIWESFGIRSARMDDAFDIGGQLLTDSGKTADDAFSQLLGQSAESFGRRMLDDIRRGDVNAWYEKFARGVEEAASKPKVFRALSSSLERSASQRSTTQGMLKAWRQIWPKAVPAMDDVSADLAARLRNVDPEFSDIVLDAIKSARKPADIEALRTVDNLRFNTETVMRAAADQMGVPRDTLDHIISDEITQQIGWIIDGLKANPNPDDVSAAMRQVKDVVQKHLDDAFERALPNVLEEMGNRAEYDGAYGATVIYGIVGDQVMARQAAHASRTDEITTLIRSIEDPFLRGKAWESYFSDSDIAWGRTWDFSENSFKGLQEGMERAGFDMPDEYVTAYQGVRQHADEFIEFRNGVNKDFYGDQTKWKNIEQVDDALDLAYEKMMLGQVNSYKQMDDIFVNSISDPVTRELMGTWRRMVREARQADMEDLAAFRKSIRGFSYEDTVAAWKDYRYSRIHAQYDIQQLEKMGEGIILGDADTVRFFEGQARLARTRPGAARTLTPEDQASIADLSAGLSQTDEAAELIRSIDEGGVPAFLTDQSRSILRNAGFSEEDVASKAPSELFDELRQAISGEADPTEGLRSTTDDIADIIARQQTAPFFDEMRLRFSDTSVTEMPDQVRVAVQLKADELTRRVDSFDAGFKTFGEPEDLGLLPADSFEDLPEAGIFASEGSTFEEWYLTGITNKKVVNLETGEALTARQAVKYALQQIIKGEGTDVGYKIYDDLRRVIFAELSDRGLPADFDEVLDFEKVLAQADEGIKEFAAPDDFRLIGGYDHIIKRELYQATGVDELWYEQGSSIFDNIETQMLRQLEQPPTRISDLPSDVAADLNKYLDRSIGELRDARHYAVRMAEGYRDSALLNYSRQYGYDALLGHIAPYQFWYTHSIMRWLWHSVDRPTMIATWAKWKDYIENSFGIQEKFPQRLQGRIKINLPFVPEEFGEMWVDPARAFGLPFEQFTDPWVRLMQDENSMSGQIDRQLEDWVQQGRITPEQFEAARAGQLPQVYEHAKAFVQENDDNDRYDIMDFMSLSVAPHLPIQMLWNLSQGEPEKIGPLPHTRFLKAMSGLQVVQDITGVTPGTYDAWGNIRESMGLPAFDQWEPYRIDRELSNMAGEGLITPDDALRGQIERTGDVFDEARARVDKVRGFQTLFNMVGLPTQPFPEGERELRSLYADFYTAIEADDNGNSLPLKEFFDENPEFETRLALWKEPEERLSQFLIDHMWDAYHNLSSLDKKLAREQLGEDFVNGFLDVENAAPTNLSPDVLNTWLQQLKGEPVGSLGTPGSAIPIDFAPPHLAKAAQGFYDARRLYFPDYFELQDKYFKLKKGGARRDWLKQNPQLGQYWDWRRGFLKNNPDLIPFLDEDFEPNFASVEEMQQAFGDQPSFTEIEISARIVNTGGTALQRRLDDFISGGTLTPTSRDALLDVSDSMGITFDQLVEMSAQPAGP